MTERVSLDPRLTRTLDDLTGVISRLEAAVRERDCRVAEFEALRGGPTPGNLFQLRSLAAVIADSDRQVAVAFEAAGALLDSLYPIATIILNKEP